MIYFLLAIMIIGVIVNDLVKKYAFDKLSFKRELSKRVVEVGEKFYSTITVENNKAFPVTFLRFTEELPPIMQYSFKANASNTKTCTYHSSTMSLMPYQRIKRKYEVFCSKRGRYTFKDVSLNAGDFIGLDTVSKDIEYSQDIIVLPERADLENEIIPYGSNFGELSVKRWIIEDPILTVGIREYTGNEPQKNIHWPSTLKYGKMMVRNFDYTADNTAMVLLNEESFRPFWIGIDSEKIEKCISIARSIFEEFEDKGIPYGFSTNGLLNCSNGSSVIYPGCGTAHLNSLLETLGTLDLGVSTEFENILDKMASSGKTVTTCVVITPKILDEYIIPLNNLSDAIDRVVVISVDEKNLYELDNKIESYFVGDRKEIVDKVC